MKGVKQLPVYLWTKSLSVCMWAHSILWFNLHFLMSDKDFDDRSKNELKTVIKTKTMSQKTLKCSGM